MRYLPIDVRPKKGTFPLLSIKRIRISSRLVTSTCLLIVGSSICTLAADRPPNFVVTKHLNPAERVAAFRSLALQLQENRNAIKTYSSVWECQDKDRISVEDAKKMAPGINVSDSESSLMRYVRAKVTVLASRQPNRLNCDFQVVSSTIEAGSTGQSTPTAGPLLHQMSIVTGEEVFTLEPNIKSGVLLDPKSNQPPKDTSGAAAEFFGRVAYREPITVAEANQWTVMVNPLDLQKTNRDMISELERFATLIEENAPLGDSAELPVPEEARGKTYADLILASELEDHDQKRIRLTIKSFVPGGQGVVEMNTDFDRGVRSNPVESNVYIAGKLRQSHVWGYRPVGDVWVPSKIGSFRFSDDGHVTFQRLLERKEEKINTPLPADSFEWKALGLKNGERVVDRIDQKILEVKDGKLSPIEVDGETSAPTSAWSYQVIGLAVSNLVLVGIVILLSRRRRSRLQGKSA